MTSVAPPLAQAGYRVIVPYLRGYGPTRFLDAATPRSGQQAALGARPLRSHRRARHRARDPRRLRLGRPRRLRRRRAVAGAGRAAWFRSPATTSRTSPRRASRHSRGAEYRYWYQWYFHTERGRAGLTREPPRPVPAAVGMWSPNWRFDDATYERTAARFDNPDFVEVVIQSYRHRYGNAPGDPA